MAEFQGVKIHNLLRTLSPSNVSAKPEEIAQAVSKIFENQVSPVQVALLLDRLSVTGLEQDPEVLAQCATVMRSAAEHINADVLRQIIKQQARGINSYKGGLCDIVGTGGDFHSTFNISTASSIIASSLLLIAKHGNRASTSKSGSADVLASMHVGLHEPYVKPNLQVVLPNTLPEVYSRTNFAFLFAPNFHKGLRHIAAIRKELPSPSIFNLLGPLTNPAESSIEARVIGVKKRDLVTIFAEALRLNGANKAMVVCGAEDLDEISCAGSTHCAKIFKRESSQGFQVEIETFVLNPEDFGLSRHPLSTVSPGKGPDENAVILRKLLQNEMDPTDPILQFVLINVAALFCISGVCDGTTSAFGDDAPVITERGPGNGRWKEGVRLAQQSIQDGVAMKMLETFAETTLDLAKIQHSR